jgi:hypothetical protein
MAAFAPVPSCAHLAIKFLGPQVQEMMVGSYWTLDTPSPMTETQVKGLADAADQVFHDVLLADFVLNSMTYTGTEVRALDAADAPVATAALNAGTGGVNLVPLPLEVALVYAFDSGLAGRSHRNRWYWPGLAVDNLSTSPKNGLWGDFAVNAYTAAFSTFFTELAASEFRHVVASRKLGSFVPVTTRTVRRRPGSQRRREP